MTCGPGSASAGHLVLTRIRKLLACERLLRLVSSWCPWAWKLGAWGPGHLSQHLSLSRFPNPRGGCWAEPSGGVGWGFELAAVPEGSCPSPPSPGPAVTAPHSPAGSKESLFSCTLTASEEAMAVLEEVILYAFQQCVYYISKVQPLRARSPGGPGCRPGRLCPPGPRPRAPGPLTCCCSHRASPLPQRGASERARRGRLLWGGGSDSGTAVRWFRLPWPRLPCPRRP